MTKVEYFGKHGEVFIVMNGHADNPFVCTAISTLIHNAMLGIERLSENYPEDISFSLTGIENLNFDLNKNIDNK